MARTSAAGPRASARPRAAAGAGPQARALLDERIWTICRGAPPRRRPAWVWPTEIALAPTRARSLALPGWRASAGGGRRGRLRGRRAPGRRLRSPRPDQCRPPRPHHAPRRGGGYRRRHPGDGHRRGHRMTSRGLLIGLLISLALNFFLLGAGATVVVIGARVAKMRAAAAATQALCRRSAARPWPCRLGRATRSARRPKCGGRRPERRCGSRPSAHCAWKPDPAFSPAPTQGRRPGHQGQARQGPGPGNERARQSRRRRDRLRRRPTPGPARRHRPGNAPTA